MIEKFRLISSGKASLKSKFLTWRNSSINFITRQDKSLFSLKRNVVPAEEYFAEIRSTYIYRTHKRVIRRWSLGSRYSLDLRVTCDLRESPPKSCIPTPDFGVRYREREKKRMPMVEGFPGPSSWRSRVLWPVSFDTVLNPIRATSRSFALPLLLLFLPSSPPSFSRSLFLSHSFSNREFLSHVRPLVPKRRINGMKAQRAHKYTPRTYTCKGAHKYSGLRVGVRLRRTCTRFSACESACLFREK